jgi:transposase-like protein
MMYIRFPRSLRNVEDSLHERGIDITHETVRFWWNRFGPMCRLQRFVSVQSSIPNHFNLERNMYSRSDF